MSDEPSAAAETPDDSPWRPGADAVFDNPGARPFEQPTPEPSSSSPSDRGRGEQLSPPQPDLASRVEVAPGAGVGVDVGPQRWIAAVVAVGALLAGAVIWTQTRPDDPTSVAVEAADEPVENRVELPETNTLPPVSAATEPVDRGADVSLGRADAPLSTRAATCLRRRLPRTVDQLWAVDVAGATRIRQPVAIGDASVLAVVDVALAVPDDPLEPDAVDSDQDVEGESDEVPPATEAVLVSFGRAAGVEQWRVVLGASLTHELVGTTGGVAIVEQTGDSTEDHRLLAFRAADGVELWQRDFDTSWSAMVEPSTGLLIVDSEPTDDASDVGLVEVLDPVTGTSLAQRYGALFSVDPDGLVVTLAGDKLVGFRVGANSVTESGTVAAELLGVVDGSNPVVTVVGEGLVVSDGDSPSLIRWAGRTDGLTRRLPMVGAPRITPPKTVQALDSLGGSAILVSGDGAVHGANIGGETIEFRWRVQGILSKSTPSDRGRSLLVSAQGGSMLTIIDGSTGREIVDVPVIGGWSETLAFAANGAVVQDSSETGRLRRAVDLDGRTRWTLDGKGRLAIGDRIVVDVIDTDGLVQLAAFGESGDGAPVCGSVMNSWDDS